MENTCRPPILRVPLLAFKTPFTLIMLAVMVAAGLYGGAHMGALDHDVHRSVGLSTRLLFGGHWHRLITSLPFTAGGWHFYASLLMLATCVGWLEYHQGTRRVLAVFFGIHLLTTIFLSLAVVLPLKFAGWDHSGMLFRARDVGPSAGYDGCQGFALANYRKTMVPWIAVALMTILLLRLAWSIFDGSGEGPTILANLHGVSRSWRHDFPPGVASQRVAAGLVVPNIVQAHVAHLVAFPSGYVAGHWLLTRKAIACPREQELDG